MEREFQDIPDGKLEEVETTGYLALWSRPNGLKWSELLLSPRVLIVSEAGSGKTFECQKQTRSSWDDGKPAFFVELALLAKTGFRNSLDPDKEPRFDSWRTSQTEEAFFFLDSFDELKLSQGSFKQALINLKRAIGDRLHRCRIIITTRPIIYDEQLVREILPVKSAPSPKPTAEDFAKTAMGESKKNDATKKNAPDWRTATLLPLSNEQVIEFAREQGVGNPDVFSQMLHEYYPPDFARRPQDLIELCAAWSELGSLRSHSEQVAASVRVKLLPHEGRAEPAELSPEKALEGAHRLALACQLSRRFTIRHHAASDSLEGEAALDPAVVLADWRPDERKALLERPLFHFASYGRVRFHHRSATEYLAAEQLSELLGKGMSMRTLNLHLFTQIESRTIVRPSKRPLAAWLALKEERIFELLRDHEPAVLLDEGDPERLTPLQRQQALRAYCERYGPGDWRGMHVPPIQVHRFASDDLAGVIQEVWERGIENPEVRDMLIDLIGAGQIKACAELVYQLACDVQAPDGERSRALRALVDIEDRRLTEITASVLRDESQWPYAVARTVCFNFFPQYMTVEELCQLIPRLNYNENKVDSLSWRLPGLISEAQLDLAQLEQLRDGLVELLSEGLKWQGYSHILCDNPYLCGAVAATCLRGLEHTLADEWLNASLLALHVHDHDAGAEEIIGSLRKKLSEVMINDVSRMFWLEDKLLLAIRKPENALSRLLDATSIDGLIQLRSERDLEWVCQALGDTSRDGEERAMLLEAAVRLSPTKDGWEEHVQGLRVLVADEPALLKRIDEFLMPQEPDEDQVRRREELAAKQNERKQKKNKLLDSWIRLCEEVANQPDVVFASDRESNTAWNLWKAMRHSSFESDSPDWNRRFLELHFNKETADRLRQVLMSMWRKERPTRPSERPEDERGTTLYSWHLGLAAIYAEAEDADWAEKLDHKQALLAARYALIELNSLPTWIDDLVAAHPRAVDHEIGNELTWNLERDTGKDGHIMLLQKIGYSSESVARLFLPRLQAWLDVKGDQTTGGEGEAGMVSRIRQVTRVILKHWDGPAQAHLFEVACQRVDQGLSPKLRLAWFPSLMRLDPALGVDVLAKELRGVKPAQNSEAISLLAALFADHDDSVDLASPGFTPQLLLRLARLAYQHIRIEDDIHHEGCFSPDVRDDAQRLRGFLVDALLKTKGDEAWAIKMEMVEDPLFAHFKDRIWARAEENRAQEYDSRVLSEEQIVQLIQKCEAPVTSNEAMFALMKDRLADLDELMSSDESPREHWASIREEKLLRREIARILRGSANAKYIVEQEAVTADEKETDIRLIATASQHQGVIELKIGDGRTVKDLKDTIKNQLVDKYLAPQDRKAGILLFTLVKDRVWVHPEERRRIKVEELKQLLCAEAARLQQESKGALLVDVHFLDLRPRLATENS